MIKTLSFRSLCRSTAATTALLASAVRADLTPEWITNLPVGSSLSAGILGMVVDPAGVTYVTGITGSSSDTDVLTAAILADGTLLWSHTWGGPANGNDQGRGIALGPGGVVWVTGNTANSLFYANVLLLAYDAASGNLLSVIQYSSGPGTSEYGGCLATDTQGNVYVGGGTVGDGSDAMVLAFDAAGQFRWNSIWDGPALAPYSQDGVLEIVMDPSGVPVVLIQGVMASNHPDYVVVKYAPSNGSTIWEANSGVSGEDSPRDMAIDASGDIYITGTGIDLTDKFSTIKLRGSDGQLLWQAYDSAGFRDNAAALALDGQGGVYVTGSVDPDGDHSNFNDNMYTVKRDASTGALLWTHLYGQNCVGCYDVPSDVIVDDAGHVFVAGTTSSPPYSADVITFVLDASTGLETQRGVVSSTSPVTARSGFLRFDAANDLFNGGELYDANTGAVEISVFKYTSLHVPSGITFCPGDGSGTACPCGNAGTAGHGCANSVNANGALLTTSGATNPDIVLLQASGMPSIASVASVFVQGDALSAGGVVFGDGVRCADGNLIRLGSKPTPGGASQYPEGGDPSVSVRGAVTPGSGVSRYYQTYYRNSAAAFCPPATFNVTNGVIITW